MKPRTKDFLKDRFKSYYQENKPHLPLEFKRREWAFIQFDEKYPDDVVMRRHKAFWSTGELRDYFKATAPAHAYYSVALYERPDAPTMREKRWGGADLVFDIDADHLPRRPLNYPDMLGMAKEEAQKILDMLLGDFGISEEYVEVVFSGGRGYHIHVRDPRVRGLGSAERREIVDYITGTGLDRVQKKRVSGEAGSETADKTLIPGEDEGGWGAKINQWIVSYLADIAARGDQDKLMEYSGVGEKTSSRILDGLEDEEVLESIRRGNADALKGASKRFWEALIEDARDNLRGHPDEPVTADTRRLIRLPGSLHGGAGLRVTPVPLDELGSFDPLSDAVVFGEEAVRVRGAFEMETVLKGEKFKMVEDLITVPEYAAVFFMCRGAAEYEPG